MTVTIKNPFRTEWNPVPEGISFFLEMKSNPLRRKLESFSNKTPVLSEEN